MEHSDYQKDIYDAVRHTQSNLLISAVAGSGKTTTLVECLNHIPNGRNSAFLAFNNAIVNELKERIKGDGIHITTMHSLCWRSLMKHYGYKCELKPNKPIKYIERICKKHDVPKKRMNWYFYVFSNMLDLMRQNLIFTPIQIIELADRHSYAIGEDEALMLIEAVELMNNNSKEFDFTDMIYRCVLDEVKMPKFDFVFVDEAQDLSKVQQNIILRIKARRGRMVAVGDPNQAIYGFAGADIDSYERMKTLFPKTIELPLSVNYRCGSSIVKEAKKINDQIEPYEKNGKGEVGYSSVAEIKNEDWVLCRNLKPLVLTNLYLLSKGVKSYVRGSDIGMGLIALVNKTGCSNTRSMLVRYQSTISKEIRRLKSRGVKNPMKSEKIDLMNQKLDILTVLSDGVMLVEHLKKKIREIFKDQGVGVCLSTIHKSKGLENDTVFFLCPELIPNQFAEQDWELVQEENLKYVAITRAKSKLLYVTDYETITEHNKAMLKRLKK